MTLYTCNGLIFGLEKNARLYAALLFEQTGVIAGVEAVEVTE